MQIERETAAYNERRYGKPWIAKVDFSASASKPEFIWGQWIGDARNGSAGILQIDLEPGDIYARGQKDFRKPQNSSPSYYQLDANGKSTGGSMSKPEAYRAWQAEQKRRAEPAEPTVARKIQPLETAVAPPPDPFAADMAALDAMM